jgi:protease-4
MFSRRLALLAGAFALLVSPSVFAEDPPPKDKGKSGEPAQKKAVTIAHIKLSGSMPEKVPTVDPLLGQIGETFKQKIDRLKKARDDKDVSALLLEIDGLAVGWGKLNELSRAIASVRAAGKKVYAHVETGSRADYLLALSADEVCLPEASWLMLTGIRAEATFYKNLLGKLGVIMDVIAIGDFKSAMESFTRDKLSEANKQQLTAILDDYYEHEIVGRIAAARKMTPEKVKALIDEAPFSARAAKENGLIDKLDYLGEYEAAIKKGFDAESVKIAKDYGKKKEEDLDIFGLYRKLLFGPSRSASSKSPKVALIYATGAIMTGKSSMSFLNGETMGSETMVKAIEEADADKTVKAIVLRVDSPGGSALASDLIWHALKKCKKPVIASMSDVAGSGGYYICMSAKKIYAEPGTITGSIGVISGKMALRGLYDKVGITTEVIARGKNSGLLGGTDLFTESERQVFKKLMLDTYDQFVDKALAGRTAAGKKMSREELVKLAGGRIYTGRQAKANGLIDEVGTLEDAIAEAAKLGGLPADKEPELLMLPKPKHSLEDLLGSVLGAQMGLDVQALRKVPGLLEALKGVDALIGLGKEPVWAIAPFRLEIK